MLNPLSATAITCIGLAAGSLYVSRTSLQRIFLFFSLHQLKNCDFYIVWGVGGSLNQNLRCFQSTVIFTRRFSLHRIAGTNIALGLLIKDTQVTRLLFL